MSGARGEAFITPFFMLTISRTVNIQESPGNGWKSTKKASRNEAGHAFPKSSASFSETSSVRQDNRKGDYRYTASIRRRSLEKSRGSIVGGVVRSSECEIQIDISKEIV